VARLGGKWPVGLKICLLLLPISLGLIVVIAALSLVYGFIVHRFFTLLYVFPANFISASVIIVVGVALNFLPGSFSSRANLLLDHSTFIEKSYDTRENRQRNARLVLWLGIYIFTLTGLIQILLSLII
jgi:hypothetical protein